jgi:hypothetical protein
VGCLGLMSSIARMNRVKEAKCGGLVVEGGPLGVWLLVFGELGPYLV